MPGIRRGSHETQGDMRPIARRAFYANGEKGSTGAVQAALRQLGLRVWDFESVDQCLTCLATQECHLVISNAKRPAEEGLRLLAAARCIQPSVPVVLLVDHGDIQTAVCAMKGQAADCLQRPLERARLVSSLSSILQKTRGYNLPQGNPLSKTETRVVQLILQGKTTAEIARALDRSHRTIEVHRSHIMWKLGTDGMVDLVKTCVRRGLVEDWP